MMRRAAEAPAFRPNLPVVFPDVEPDELAREAAAEQREAAASGALAEYPGRRFGLREPAPGAYPADM